MFISLIFSSLYLSGFLIGSSKYSIFKCDNCSEEFTRDKGRIDPKRLCDDYSHVCPKCDPKRFAQKRGVEQRKRLNLRVDSMIDITKL